VLYRITFAGNGAFAANVERLECVQLAGIRDSHSHTELLLHVRIRDRRLHSAEFERKSSVIGKVREYGRDEHGLRRKRQRCAGTNSAGGRRNGRAVLGHKRRTRAVVSSRAIDVGLNHCATACLTGLDRPLYICNAGLFNAKLALRLRWSRARREHQYEKRSSPNPQPIEKMASIHREYCPSRDGALHVAASFEIAPHLIRSRQNGS